MCAEMSRCSGNRSIFSPSSTGRASNYPALSTRTRSKDRVSGSSARNSRLLEELCGPEGLPNVVLLSTMWEQIVPHSMRHREACGRGKKLVTDKMFWSSMRRGGEQGATVQRRQVVSVGSCGSLVNETKLEDAC